jgi:hypothetical protein
MLFCFDIESFQFDFKYFLHKLKIMLLLNKKNQDKIKMLG